jgi:hypothetical protein
MRKALALILILSWIAFSTVDALQDLDFDSHAPRDAGTAQDRPGAAEPEKQTNDILELANSSPVAVRNLAKHLDFQSTLQQPFAGAYSAAKALRSHKEHCILLI